jgi:CheY-like chemotaxis protein
MATLRLIKRMFQERDQHLEVALQGELALLMAQRLRPRLIFLDLHLPDMKGEDVLRQLKADPITAAIPVIVVTADAWSKARDDHLLALGALTCLQKPLTSEQIANILDASAPTATAIADGTQAEIPGPPQPAAAALLGE